MKSLISKLTIKQTLILLGLGSGGLLAAALVFQHVFGYWPCTMCLWQRWPHWAVLGLGCLAFLLPGLGEVISRRLLLLAAATLLVTAGLAFWHSGVEWGLLPGPTACSGGLSFDGNTADLLDQLIATPAPRCDEVTWSFLFLSMANWNGFISLAMAVFGVMVWKRPQSQTNMN